MASPDQVHRQAAPGELERVRELLNSWLIPNDTRVPTDRFAEYAQDRRLEPPEAGRLRRLRDDLRAVVERDPASDERFNGWLDEARIRWVVRERGLALEHRAGLAAELVATVVEAIAAGELERLKACPDCHWVFYDHTRNASKRWCLMNAGGPNGRACGTIAKVRSFRERARVVDSHPTRGRVPSCHLGSG
jgi:hypothetical protein